MTRDELEFQISQYVDGTLSAVESAALESRLAMDGEAQALLSEYRRFQTHLRRGMPLPAIQWNRLAETLSVSVADSREQAIAGQIGWNMQSRWAIAASVLIVLGMGILISVRSHSGFGPIAAPSVALIEGPQAETAAGPAIADISVGPSPALAARGDSWRYAESVVTRPSHIELAGEIRPAIDGDSHIR